VYGAERKFDLNSAIIDLGATMKKSQIAWLSAFLLLVAGSASAHHSFAMFDRSKETTLVGVVNEFEWTNPHSWIELDVPNENGGTDKWSIELNSPNNLSRQGWKSTSLKPGDKISIHERSRKMGSINAAMAAVDKRPMMSWLELDKENYTATFKAPPVREELNEPAIREQLVVEYYSR